MEILHEVKLPTEYEYGYLVWKNGEKYRYKEIFPDKEEFDVVFMGKKVLKRKVDWKRNRINLYPIREQLDEGDILILRRDGDMVYIEKK
ncbi:MAG: hypothetical protein QMD80_01855 [archaeon]|nr:hypothetical protein [archaeon]